MCYEVEELFYIGFCLGGRIMLEIMQFKDFEGR